MIEITLGACPAGFGTVPRVSIMGRRHQLFPYQFECPTESNGSCTCIYIYVCVCVSNLSITLISEWTQQSKDPHLKLYGNSMWSQKFWSVRNLRRFSSVSLGLSVSVAICILSGSINPIFRMFLLLQSRIFILHNRVQVIYRQWIEITKQVICRQRIEKLTDNSNS